MIDNNIDIKIDEIKAAFLNERDIKLLAVRLDLIHPVISGNKLFKLYYFIDDAIKLNKNTVVTMGGAYSNHLVATACYTKQLNLNSIGIIRGEEPKNTSATLKQCSEFGMKLIFVPRIDYQIELNEVIIQKINKISTNYIFIPEGGYDSKGAAGASIIMNNLQALNPSHICTAIGTATTLAGLIKSASPNQKVIGVPVIKGMTDIDERLTYLLGSNHYEPPIIFNHFDFGGYARHTNELINFMNDFYGNFNIPLDFVYTGKMFYAIFDKIKNNFFPKGSTIALLHTGGLQGNQSLPMNTLIF